MVARALVVVELATVLALKKLAATLWVMVVILETVVTAVVVVLAAVDVPVVSWFSGLNLKTSDSANQRFTGIVRHSGPGVVLDVQL